MSSLDAAVFEDAGRLQEWLVSHQRTPYVDFEILTVTLSDGALEVDPMGDLKSLMGSTSKRRSSPPNSPDKNAIGKQIHVR